MKARAPRSRSLPEGPAQPKPSPALIDSYGQLDHRTRPTIVATSHAPDASIVRETTLTAIAQESQRNGLAPSATSNELSQAARWSS